MAKKHKQVGIRYTDESNSQISRQEVVLMARSSFLPTPKELKEYEELLPGITERFFFRF